MNNAANNSESNGKPPYPVDWFEAERAFIKAAREAAETAEAEEKRTGGYKRGPGEGIFYDPKWQDCIADDLDLKATPKPLP